MLFGNNVSVWIQAVLSAVVILVLGWQFQERPARLQI
jgi:hypothetical protein